VEGGGEGGIAGLAGTVTVFPPEGLLLANLLRRSLNVKAFGVRRFRTAFFFSLCYSEESGKRKRRENTALQNALAIATDKVYRLYC
jgi:hypothetical protein